MTVNLARLIFFDYFQNGHISGAQAEWGALRANWIYLKVGARWGLGFRKGLERHYPDVRFVRRRCRSRSAVAGA